MTVCLNKHYSFKGWTLDKHKSSRFCETSTTWTKPEKNGHGVGNLATQLQGDD